MQSVEHRIGQQEYHTKQAYSFDPFDAFLFKIILLRSFAQLLFAYKLFPNSVLNAISALILLLFINYIVKNKEINFFPRELFFYWLLFGYALYSIVDTGFTFKGFSDLFSYFFYYIIACYFKSKMNFVDFEFLEKKFLTFTKIFFVVMFIQIPLAVIGFGDKSTIGSLFGHANPANLLLGFFIVYFINQKKNLKVAGLFFLMLVLGGRTSIIATAIIAVAVFIGMYFRSATWRLSILVLTAIALYMVFSYLIVLADNTNWNDRINLLDNIESGGDFSLDSLKWRLQNWGYYLDELLIDTNAFVFGKGIGAYVDVSPQYFGRFFEVHNDFLKIGYDLGLVGLCLFLLADISLGVYFCKGVSGVKFDVVLIYLLRYSFMFFDNLVTNFLGIVVFVGFLYFLVCKSHQKVHS